MRLDVYLKDRGFSSRTRAARAIVEGRVLVNGKPARASDEIRETDLVEVREEEEKFASEGGKKLRRFFNLFPVERADGLVFADLGASTGGFCDVLLKGGARRVYAVDVGEGQLEARIAGDERIVVMDRTNARYLTKESFPERIDAVTGDLSFISLRLILPAVADILSPGGKAYLLCKPQFECGGKGLDKHGVVKDEGIRAGIVQKVCAAASVLGLHAFAAAETVPPGRGNREYVLGFVRGDGKARDYAAFAAEAAEKGRAVFSGTGRV